MVANAIDLNLLGEIAGGPDLVVWFGGRLPSFHDSEIVELSLDRVQSRCLVRVHAFETKNEVDAEGYFVTAKHVVITFHLDWVSELELTDFNHQNVIDGLQLERLPNGNLLLTLEPCYGLSGKMEAKELRITLEPGKPADSVYRRKPAKP